MPCVYTGPETEHGWRTLSLQMYSSNWDIKPDRIRVEPQKLPLCSCTDLTVLLDLYAEENKVQTEVKLKITFQFSKVPAIMAVLLYR